MRSELDISDLASIAPLMDRLNPAAVINCAAYTHVDLAEANEPLATTVNTDAVAVLAEWAHQARRPFLTFSTDYVFDGSASDPYVESSPTEPINAYGRSKVGGERIAAELGGLVVRTSWVISGSHPNFVATILKTARDRELRVVDDQYGCPTIAGDLAEASYEALEAGATGILHLTNKGETTWFELAREAVAEAGLPREKVTPCSSNEFPTVAKRPGYSVLGSERLNSLDVDQLPRWQESLPSVVAEIATWI